jgi:hypothetical protein
LFGGQSSDSRDYSVLFAVIDKDELIPISIIEAASIAVGRVATIRGDIGLFVAILDKQAKTR